MSGEIPRYGAYHVYCHICGWRWSENDPGVRFIQTDGVWECFDEAECFDRKSVRPVPGWEG